MNCQNQFCDRAGPGRVGGLVFLLCIAGIVGVRGPKAAFSQGAGNAAEAPLVTVEQVARQLEVTDIQTTETAVSGRIVNRSDVVLRDVRLVVRNVWLWNDERNPGTDNPGRTGFYTVAGDIPPQGSVGFVSPLDPPLPDRDDGQFKTIVEVLGFDEVGS